MNVKLQVFHLMIGSSNMGKRLYFASYYIPFSSWYSKLIIFEMFCSSPFDDSLMYDCLLFDAYDKSFAILQYANLFSDSFKHIIVLKCILHNA